MVTAACPWQVGAPCQRGVPEAVWVANRGVVQQLEQAEIMRQQIYTGLVWTAPFENRTPILPGNLLVYGVGIRMDLGYMAGFMRGDSSD
jgi:hypothetical protein